MFTFGNPFTKVIFYAKVKAQNYIDLISHRICAAFFSETQESAEGRSARLFWLLNLVFLASLILLSPDKVTEMFPSARPSWPALDWIQDLAETLGKLAHF